MSYSTEHKPPSVNDTHCDGAGLLPSTSQWTRAYCEYKRYAGIIPQVLPYPPPIDLTGKNVLISGANSGIGMEAAYTFALWGAKVILACRDPPPRELHPDKAIETLIQRSGGKIAKSQLEWWQVDFASLKSVEVLGKRWIDSGMVLDYLCNNAGLLMVNMITTEDGYELTRSVNYLGHCLLTLIVLPAMKKAKAPRIVNTCSSFHYGGRLDFNSLDYEKGQSRGQGGVNVYCDTKLYHVMWTFELQARLSRSREYRHVIANAVHPGFVGSNIWNNPDIKNLPWPTQPIIAFLLIESDLPPPEGMSAKLGGLYLNRNIAIPARPECYDVLATSRMWQRTLEDIKAKERGLDNILPGHLPAVL